jgi:hypothetical protein
MIVRGCDFAKRAGGPRSSVESVTRVESGSTVQRAAFTRVGEADNPVAARSSREFEPLFPLLRAAICIRVHSRPFVVNLSLD